MVHSHKMKNDMKQRYSVFLRPWGVFYYEDHQTGKQETLKTRDKDEAYAVAQQSGLSQQAIGYMEKGHRIPSLETVLRVAKAMNVDLAVIIKRAQKELSKAP